MIITIKIIVELIIDSNNSRFPFLKYLILLNFIYTTHVKQIIKNGGIKIAIKTTIKNKVSEIKKSRASIVPLRLINSNI